MNSSSVGEIILILSLLHTECICFVKISRSSYKLQRKNCVLHIAHKDFTSSTFKEFYTDLILICKNNVFKAIFTIFFLLIHYELFIHYVRQFLGLHIALPPPCNISIYWEPPFPFWYYILSGCRTSGHAKGKDVNKKIQIGIFFLGYPIYFFQKEFHENGLPKPEPKC